jgi:hypothetical protein
MTYTSRRPLSYFSNPPAGDALARACACELLSAAGSRLESATKIAAREFGKDSDAHLVLRDARLLERGAVAPTSTSSTGGGDMLVQGAVPDFLSNMGPASAGVVLLSRGLQLSFGQFGVINVPFVTGATGSTAFVAEGAPIPARQLSLDAVSLTPSKFAVVTSFTHETLTSSTPNVVAVVSQVLTEAVGLDLDTELLSTTAATSIRPAGLRFGVAGLAHEATASGSEAMIIDLGTLAAAVAPTAGNGPIVFIASPRQAASIKLRAPAGFPYEVLSSSALTAGTVIAVATNALVSAVDPTPTITTANQMTVHENTVPLPIVDGSSTPAPGTRSGFQTDTIGLKLVLHVAWGLRSTSALSWTSSVVW